jgi:hypothetical protein
MSVSIKLSAHIFGPAELLRGICVSISSSTFPNWSLGFTIRELEHDNRDMEVGNRDLGFGFRNVDLGTCRFVFVT